MRKIQKVLIVCSIYKPHIGGVETMIDELAASYKKRNIKTVVLTKKFPDTLCEREIINDILILRLPRPQRFYEYIHSVNWLKINIKDLKSDVVHIIGVRRPMPLYGLLLSRLWNVPYVVTFSGGDILDPNDETAIKIWKEGKTTVPQSLLQADYYTAISRSVRNQVYNCLPTLKKVNIINAGIRFNYITNHKPISINIPYLISIRRLVFSKGIDILIKAFSVLTKQFNDLDLYIIGDGPERSTLEKLVANLNVSNRVRFLGTLDSSEYIPYLRGAVAHVCPSRAEGGGIVNFEAQAARCPAIGSDAGGIPEYILNDKTGLLFRSEDYENLALKIKKLLINKIFRDKIVKNGYENVRKYDWDILANQYIKMYTKNFPSKEFMPWSILTKKMWDDIKLI